MKKITMASWGLILGVIISTAQVHLDSIMPVRGLCIGAPNSQEVDLFVKFISEDLKSMGVNTLVLMVDFGYAYESHPELRAENPLSKSDVKKLVAACQDANIQIIPQINLLGHQSWHETVNPLLREYPELTLLDDGRVLLAGGSDRRGHATTEAMIWTPAGPPPGDCDGNRSISIGEVQRGINMFLGQEPVDCGVDCDQNGTASLGEVQKVINGFLGNEVSC